MVERTFTNTAKALEEFDATESERQKLWDAIETNADCDKAEKADKDALRKVQEAFHEDTKDINRLDDCYLVTLEFMRRMAKEYP